MDKKILVAIDGSAYSSNSLNYLVRLFNTDQDISVHLFSVVSAGSSDQNWMFEVDPLRKHSAATERKKITAKRYLRDAKARLVKNGFGEDKVTFSLEVTSTQIATSIHHEANRGIYDALVIGRRGIGKVGDWLLGSVSSNLVDTCHEVPLWVIDGEITSKRFLLAVHCTPKSLLAADHLGYFVHGDEHVEVMLYHSKILFRREPQVRLEEYHRIWGKKWCDRYLDPENYLFYAHAQILKDYGVPKKGITQLPMRTELDASRDLIKQATKNDCGTIVIGRRPRGSEKGIFGGVSDRTLGHAQNLALWLVG